MSAFVEGGVMRTRSLSLALSLFGLLFAGCVMPTTSGGSDAGATSKIDTGAPATSGNPTGTGCGTDPATGVTLCTGTTECPGVTFDPAVFPGCGFYISGATLNLECLCAGYLCPMGAAPTCMAAAALLQSTNEGAACSQVSSNGCSQIPGGGAGGAAGSGAVDSGKPSSCDPNCESMCAGEPDCIQLCGC